VLQLIKAQTNNKIKIERFYDPTLPEIDLDKGQLIQAVLNIIGNAIDAQEGSKCPIIGITTQFERMFTINQHTYRQALKICIWDKGAGVDNEMQEIIFDPLITTKHDGTGLGLSITQEIIQRHQGVVQLEEYKGNTCFSITLPYSQQEDSVPKQEIGNDLKK
jgi:two-component system nitrogen regulation sensor histidine kinase GlnL